MEKVVGGGREGTSGCVDVVLIGSEWRGGSADGIVER